MGIKIEMYTAHMKNVREKLKIACIFGWCEILIIFHGDCQVCRESGFVVITRMIPIEKQTLFLKKDFR